MTHLELNNDVCIDIRNMTVFLKNIDITMEVIAETLKKTNELLEETRKDLQGIDESIRYYST